MKHRCLVAFTLSKLAHSVLGFEPTTSCEHPLILFPHQVSTFHLCTSFVYPMDPLDGDSEGADKPKTKIMTVGLSFLSDHKKLSGKKRTDFVS